MYIHVLYLCVCVYALHLHCWHLYTVFSIFFVKLSFAHYYVAQTKKHYTLKTVKKNLIIHQSNSYNSIHIFNKCIGYCNFHKSLFWNVRQKLFLFEVTLIFISTEDIHKYMIYVCRWIHYTCICRYCITVIYRLNIKKDYHMRYESTPCMLCNPHLCVAYVK